MKHIYKLDFSSMTWCLRLWSVKVAQPLPCVQHGHVKGSSCSFHSLSAVSACPQDSTSQVLLLKHLEDRLTACGGPISRKIHKLMKLLFFPCIFISTIVSCCRCWCCRREPPAPVFQGLGGPFGRPGASGSASLSTPVMGQATAFKWDRSQVSIFLFFSTSSAGFMIHYFFK